MARSPGHSIAARFGNALVRDWHQLTFRGKALVCIVAFLAFNLAVVVIRYSVDKPAKPDLAGVATSAASSQAKEPDGALLPAIHIWTLDDESRPVVIGDVGYIVCDSASIEKVIDDHSAIVIPYRLAQHDTRDSYGMQTHISFSSQPLLPVVLKHWSTAGKVTGQQVALGKTVLRAAGTSNHKTIEGGSVTIYDMEVVDPLVTGDTVRLGFPSGTICKIVHDHACIVRPYKDRFDFAPIMLIGLPMKEKRVGNELPLDQMLFRVTDRPMIDRDGDSLPVYTLEVVKPL